MNEYTASLLVVFSQVGVVLVVAAIVITFFVMRRKHKDSNLAKDFVGNLKQGESERKNKLIEVLQAAHGMEEDMAQQTAHAMLTCEKQIYNRVLGLFLGGDREALGQLRKDVENMAAAYRKIAETVGEGSGAGSRERPDSPKLSAQLRTQIKQITAERDKLQRDLNEAMISMENMLKEYTQMYSGGARKEGVMHIENEFSQLKQKIKENLVEDVSEDDEDIPDVPPTDNKQ